MKPIFKSLIFIAILCLSSALHAQDKQPMIGQAAPPFTLKGLDGKTYSLAEQKGKYVVLHFATTWCPFCTAEAPYLEQLYRSYSSKGVQVFIVDVKEDKKLVAKTFKRFNFSFPVLLDQDGSVSTKYAPEGVQPDLARDEVPIASNLIIDKEGKIRFYSLLNTATFDAKLTKVKEKLDELLTGDSSNQQKTDIIKITVPEIIVDAGKSSTIHIGVEVKNEYHIMANKVNYEYLIPTTLKINADKNIMPGEQKFPQSKKFRLEGSGDYLNIYDGNFDISIVFTTTKNIQKGKHTLAAKFRYQACDSKSCLSPKTIDFFIPIEVIR